ncbi:hypothetical protein THAR02_03408 [Trichoderma harzianum]|uniref:Uncharacterized protein n=1 Tax=Trichoderma harzianum TaxID=5544 RepID=A0A0G0AHH8_TRIHA|nr:hypothetical protein THAR02_03408 [Trichoderma harzianum]
MSSSDKTEATAPDDPTKPILVNGEWPEEWKDDPENPGANIAKALADAERRSVYWESRGMPGIRLSADKTKIVPIQYPNPNPLYLKQTGDRLDTNYITMKRKSRPEQPEKSTCYVIEDGERYAPTPPLDKYGNDTRSVDRPTDVTILDNPAADTNYWLERGNKFVSEVMSDSWRPGQLIGENGSDPATISQSPSYAPFNPNLQFSERRSATSTGHILQYERPPNVGLGWGDYDRFTEWQSHGRQVTKDMVEKKEWRKDPLAPIDFVDENGEVVETLTIPFTREQLSNWEEPLTLYEQLNQPDNQK